MPRVVRRGRTPTARGRVAPGLDYGYALTSYAVQGATLPASSSAVTAGARRRELYVNLTRGRHDNHLFVAAPSDTLAGEGHLPRPPEDDVVAEVLAAVGRPDEDRSALEIDPLALAVADCRCRPHRRRSPGAPRCHEQQTGHELAVAARAEQIAANAAARAAIAEPPPWTVAMLPPRPDVPWLAARWDVAVGAVGAYRARWEPTPIPAAPRQASFRARRLRPAERRSGPTALRLVGDVWAARGGASAPRPCTSRRHADDASTGRSWCPRRPGSDATYESSVPTVGSPAAFPIEALARLYGDVGEFRPLTARTWLTTRCAGRTHCSGSVPRIRWPVGSGMCSPIEPLK